MRGSKPNIEIAEKGGEGRIAAPAAQQTDGRSPAVPSRCRLTDGKEEKQYSIMEAKLEEKIAF